MTPLRAIFLGLIAYGAFLLGSLPAGVVTARVEAASHGQASFAGVSGTAWSGAASARVNARGLAFAIDEIRWRFQPLRLLAGEAAWILEARMPELAASVEAARSPSQYRLRDLRASGDAAVLAKLLPIAAAWQPSGTIAVEAALVEFDGKNLAGKAIAEWRDATLSLSEARPLGSWRVEAVAEGAAAKVTLATVRGPLLLAGTGTWSLSGHLTLTGDARAESGRERELESVLNRIGPRRADGAHAIAVR